MNTKDFVVLPWGKSGNSIKLKYKNVQQLRMEKIQLELENQEMEKKFQEFQSTRSKENEETKSSGYHWKSGKAGQLGYQSHMLAQSKGNAIKLSAGKVKLKLLKHQIQEPVKQAVHYKMANPSGSEKPRMRGKVCGQCENKAALLVCLECGEDYCSGCFAKIHQKGALKLHRTTLLQAKSQILSSVLDVAHQFIREVNPHGPKDWDNTTKEFTKSQIKPESPLPQGSNYKVEIATTQSGEHTTPRDRPLCKGSGDEDASAQTFQEVLSQQRTGSHDDNDKEDLHAAKPDSLEECEVQTNLKIWREPLTIEFTEDSLSYMEKLWLKKHRRTPQEQPFNVLPDASRGLCKSTSETQCSQNENDDDSDVEDTKVQHPTLFMPVEELKIERPEPSLRIIELDDACEEEFEEPGDTVPYKVELAAVKSHLSCTYLDFHKNSFPHGNDIYQQYVFNKGKTDLLNLCLGNNSTYCKEHLEARTSNTDLDNVVDPVVYIPAIEKIGESISSEENLKEKSIETESNKKSDDSCQALESKDSLPSIDLDKPSLEKKLFQNMKESLEFNFLHEKPIFEDSKTTEAPLLLEEIALRSKPVTEPYQGLERFFTADKKERLNFLPSQSVECSQSFPRIPLAEDKQWIPGNSLSAHADNAVALGVLQSVQNPLSSTKQQKIGQDLQRPSTANLPLCSSVRKRSSCLSSPCPQSRSAAAQSLSRAASEISDIEYIDVTDQNEPFLDNINDQQTLDSLEKELNVLRSLADPSEKLYSQASEELRAFNDDLLNISQISTDCLMNSHGRGPCGIEELSSSGKDTETRSLLLFSESSTDEEEEDFRDKQHVITLPWSKST